MKLVLRKVGEQPGFCRKLYRSVKTKRLYIQQEEFDGVFVWYSATESSRWESEPDCPLRKDIEIEIVPEKRCSE